MKEYKRGWGGSMPLSCNMFRVRALPQINVVRLIFVLLKTTKNESISFMERKQHVTRVRNVSLLSLNIYMKEEMGEEGWG